MRLFTGISLDATAITRIEKDTRGIRLNEAVAIASALNTTVDQLLRPAAPLDEQIQQAKRDEGLARMRAASAMAKFEAALRRERYLEEVLAEELAWQYGSPREESSGIGTEAS